MRMHIWHLAFMTPGVQHKDKDNPVNISWSIVIKGLRFRIKYNLKFVIMPAISGAGEKI